MDEAEKHSRSAKSKSVTIAGILLLCFGVLLTLASAAALSRSDSTGAIVAVPCLLMAASGLATIRRWRGWRYYSGVWALLFAYAGVGSALHGAGELLIAVFLPQQEILFGVRPGTAPGMVFILVALALFGLGAFIIRANRREPLSPGQNSAEPAIVGGLFLLIGLGCWIGFVGGIAGEKGPATVGFLIAALILSGIGVSLTFRLDGWTAVAAVVGWLFTVLGVLAIIFGTADFLFSRGLSFAPLKTTMGGVLFLLFGRYVLAVRRQDQDTGTFGATQRGDRETSKEDMQLGAHAAEAPLAKPPSPNP